MLAQYNQVGDIGLEEILCCKNNLVVFIFISTRPPGIQETLFKHKFVSIKYYSKC